MASYSAFVSVSYVSWKGRFMVTCPGVEAEYYADHDSALAEAEQLAAEVGFNVVDHTTQEGR